MLKFIPVSCFMARLLQPARAFRQAGVMCRHLLTPSGDLASPCQKCNQSFRLKQTFQRHYLIYSHKYIRYYGIGLRFYYIIWNTTLTDLVLHCLYFIAIWKGQKWCAIYIWHKFCPANTACLTLVWSENIQGREVQQGLIIENSLQWRHLSAEMF